MRIEAIDMFWIRMPLVGEFRISRGAVRERHILLLRVRSEGACGWGEAAADRLPLYTYESTGTCWHIIEEFLGPELLAADLPEQGAALAVAESMRRWPWHPMAKAAVEEAVWDLEARRRGVPVHRLYAGERPVRARIEVGISLGIQREFAVLRAQIEDALRQGYRRIKLKIQPGHDVDVVERVRAEFGDIPLMVDANCAYGAEDLEHLRRLDAFGLEMIEQPFEHDELELHARLQGSIATPLCLDESARTPALTARALAMGAARVINVKCARLGGRSYGVAVHDLCVQQGVPVWCGGMLEAGVGRLHNVAIASLPGFRLANDLSASRRYWREDIIEPPVEIDERGTVAVPTGEGIGAEVVEERIRARLVRERTLTRARARS